MARHGHCVWAMQNEAEERKLRKQKQERLRGDAHQVAFGRNQWSLLIYARVSLGENYRSVS